MRFLIFGRRESSNPAVIAKFCDCPHIWISFTDPCGKKIDLPPHPKRLGEIHHQFDDIDKKDECWFGDEDRKIGRMMVAMTDEQAKSVYDFAMQFKDSAELICVNCEAGICRSSGAAAALSLILNGEEKISDDPRYLPNSWVKTRILRAAMNDKYKDSI